MSTIIMGDIAEGSKWWSFADFQKRELARLYKQNNAFMQTWKFPTADVKVHVMMRGGQPVAFIYVGGLPDFVVFYYDPSYTLKALKVTSTEIVNIPVKTNNAFDKNGISADMDLDVIDITTTYFAGKPASYFFKLADISDHYWYFGPEKIARFALYDATSIYVDYLYAGVVEAQTNVWVEGADFATFDPAYAALNTNTLVSVPIDKPAGAQHSTLSTRIFNPDPFSHGDWKDFSTLTHASYYKITQLDDALMDTITSQLAITTSFSTSGAREAGDLGAATSTLTISDASGVVYTEEISSNSAFSYAYQSGSVVLFNNLFNASQTIGVAVPRGDSNLTVYTPKYSVITNLERFYLPAGSLGPLDTQPLIHKVVAMGGFQFDADGNPGTTHSLWVRATYTQLFNNVYVMLQGKDNTAKPIKYLGGPPAKVNRVGPIRLRDFSTAEHPNATILDL